MGEDSDFKPIAISGGWRQRPQAPSGEAAPIIPPEIRAKALHYIQWFLDGGAPAIVTTHKMEVVGEPGKTVTRQEVELKWPPDQIKEAMLLAVPIMSIAHYEHIGQALQKGTSIIKSDEPPLKTWERRAIREEGDREEAQRKDLVTKNMDVLNAAYTALRKQPEHADLPDMEVVIDEGLRNLGLKEAIHQAQLGALRGVLGSFLLLARDLAIQAELMFPDLRKARERPPIAPPLPPQGIAGMNSELADLYKTLPPKTGRNKS